MVKEKPNRRTSAHKELFPHLSVKGKVSFTVSNLKAVHKARGDGVHLQSQQADWQAGCCSGQPNSETLAE